MGKILLFMVLLAEMGFVIWNFICGRRHRKEKEAVRVCGLFLILLLLAAGVLQGMWRYGMFAGLLVLQTAVNGWEIFRERKAAEKCVDPLKKFSKRKTVLAAAGNVMLYCFTLLPAVLFPQYEAPEVTGPFEVETSEYTWVDAERTEMYSEDGGNRTLTVKFWYPKNEKASSGQEELKQESEKYPLVVFSHGAFGVIDSNFSTCMELASHGYVVASIGHTYHAMFVEDCSGKVTMVSQEFIRQVYEANEPGDAEKERTVYENSLEWMAVRTGDENFVLDTIKDLAGEKNESPWNLINTEKIGLFGHSMGGASSVALGRQRSDIDAVIDLEGTMLGEYTGFENGLETFREEPYPVPLLDINSAAVYEQAATLPGRGYVNFYVGDRAADYHYKVIENAGHLNFTDLPMVSPFLAGLLGVGETDPKECIEEINQTILDFFEEYLKEQ